MRVTPVTMTKWAEEYLCARGLSKWDAREIVEAWKPEPQTLVDRWDEMVSSWPAMARGMLAVSLRRAALAWIEANCPDAWYKPLFDGTADSPTSNG